MGMLGQGQVGPKGRKGVIARKKRENNGIESAHWRVSISSEISVILLFPPISIVYQFFVKLD